jgi:hypothetical protein
VIGAGGKKHHCLAVFQMFQGALENEVLRRVVRAVGTANDFAVRRTRNVSLFLPSRDLTDEIACQFMHGPRHSVALLQDDLVILRNVGIEDCIGRGPVNV